ncbi:hypothetical protein [Halomicrobium katesii]|uniref:hypothetical protein n=1 Tax=Halomicrobium katesii TaxID=437163 RepID=UPI00037DF139|nr:hypothetical protein [Halomicrobium katesii]
MEAEITGENDERIGLYVYDNNDVEHWIEMDFDGEIKYHDTEGYPKHPSDRTQEENEHGRQARRYAKYHVYRERGYETMPRHENPDYLAAAMIALSGLADDSIDEQFGDLRKQIESHYDGSTVELPFEDAHPDDPLVYRKDLYLSPDPTTVEPPLVDQYADVVASIRADSEAVLTESDDIEHQLLELVSYQDRLDSELLSFEVEAVSDMYTLHTDGKTEQTTEPTAPLDREPDARIELPPLDIRQFDLFKLLLVTNLSCQVRDRFLMMGEQPPEAFQHRGFGTYRGTVKQQINPMYEQYYTFSGSTSNWTPTSP